MHRDTDVIDLACDRAVIGIVGVGESAAKGVGSVLSEIVCGDATGRGNADDITLYKSVGVAVQDAAAAALILAAATKTGTGTHVGI